MSDLHVRYLLVGGGVASSAAAGAIRRRDREGALLLVGQEINRPYQRTALTSDYLLRRVGRDALFTMPPDWYERNGVSLRTGTRVSHLDTARQAAILASGEEVSYDRVLLATGATPRALEIPGARLPNLFYLRTLEDADRLYHAVETAKLNGRRHDRGRGAAAVIGGGVLGVELAATLTQLGLAVDLIVAHPHPWARFAGDNAGRLLAAYLQKNGVNVHLAAPAQRLEGDGRVQRVALGNGQTLPCDFAVAAVGVLPNKELLRGTPIAAGKSILVDEHCRSSVPTVYAAGDCAAVFDPLFGKHCGLAHWDDAAGTGALAGANMAAAALNEPAARYDSVGVSSTRVFDLPVRAWGVPRLVDRRIVRGTPPPNAEAPQLIEFGVASDGRLAHVLAIGHADDEELLRQAVAGRARIAGNEESLKDPSAPLAALFS
jgi:NADPH-dependent 2,4-dienoyl-CoA reductase/sulfur reductase-like enzyme